MKTVIFHMVYVLVHKDDLLSNLGHFKQMIYFTFSNFGSTYNLIKAIQSYLVWLKKERHSITSKFWLTAVWTSCDFMAFLNTCPRLTFYLLGLPRWSVVKNLPANAGDVGLIHGSGRSPGEGNSKPLQYSCLGNPMDRGAWQAIVHGVAKNSDMT